MKITIDTKEDSEQEIRKAIRLLISLVGSKDVYTNDPDFSEPEKTKNIFENDEPAPNLMGIFDSAPEESKEDSEEPSDESPQVEFY